MSKQLMFIHGEILEVLLHHPGLISEGLGVVFRLAHWVALQVSCIITNC